MQCVICFEKKWVLVPDCKHVICISCLLKIKKDECPYCRKKLFTTFPKHLVNLLNIDISINTINACNTTNIEIMDISDDE